MYKQYNKIILPVFCILLLTTLVGCLGSESSTFDIEEQETQQNESNHINTSEPAPEPEPTPETGSINGQVVDDSFTPIQGGLVSLTNNTGTVTETFTDKEGKYTINDIKPGEYGLRFTAECCEEHLERIRIQADRTTTTSPILVAWGGHEPYVHPDEWTGLLCADGPESAFSYCSVYDESHDNRHDFDVKRGIKTLLVALTWNDGFNLKDCLWMELRFQAFQDDFSGQIEQSDPCQENPIEFRVDAGEMETPEKRSSYEGDFDNITTEVGLQFHVRAECTTYQMGCDRTTWLDEGDLYPNIVYQQRFTVYWEEHYWEHAPEGASALPDQ